MTTGIGRRELRSDVDDELWRGIARDGFLDIAYWPGLLDRLHPRLENVREHSGPDNAWNHADWL